MGRLIKLHKVKGSSLVETITATIILMLVFAIAITSIGNIMERTARNKSSVLDKELNRLEYLYHHGKVSVPDVLQESSYQLSIDREKEGELTYIVLRARSNSTSKTRRVLER